MLFKFNNIADLCIDICIIYSSISITKQECIALGCIPPAAVAINWRGLPQCMLGYTTWVWAWRPRQVWAWRPPGCGPGDPTDVSLENHQVWACRPPKCGPGDPPVWAWRPPWPDPSSSPLGLVLETCKACWDTQTTPPRDLQGMLGYYLQGMLEYHPPL